MSPEPPLNFNSGRGNPRYLGLHDNATGAVSLIDRDEKLILWSGEAGDRSLWKGFMARGGFRKVAERLVHDLKDAILKSQ